MFAAMDCPFCEKLATMQPPNGYDGDVLDCPKYGRVKIARTALPKLNALDLHARVLALFRAMRRVRAGDVPEITSAEVSG